MTVKDWFEQRKESQIARRAKETQIDDSIGKLWVKCYNCNAQLLRKDVEENLDVCPKCNYHFRINARTRINQLFITGHRPVFLYLSILWQIIENSTPAKSTGSRRNFARPKIGQKSMSSRTSRPKTFRTPDFRERLNWVSSPKRYLCRED